MAALHYLDCAVSSRRLIRRRNNPPEHSILRRDQEVHHVVAKRLELCLAHAHGHAVLPDGTARARTLHYDEAHVPNARHQAGHIQEAVAGLTKTKVLQDQVGQLPCVLFDPHPGDTDLLLLHFWRKQRGINFFYRLVLIGFIIFWF